MRTDFISIFRTGLFFPIGRTMMISMFMNSQDSRLNANRVQPAAPQRGFYFLVLFAFLFVRPAFAQKTFLKSANEGPGQLAQFVDSAMGPDGSTYYIFDNNNFGTTVSLDDRTTTFQRTVTTFLAKMSP